MTVWMPLALILFLDRLMAPLASINKYISDFQEDVQTYLSPSENKIVSRSNFFSSPELLGSQGELIGWP